MAMFKNYRFLILLNLIISAYSFGQDKSSDANKTIAIVNGSNITHGELESAYLQRLRVVTTQKVTRKKVLTDLINRRLGIEKAKKNQIGQNPIIKEKIEDILFHAQISKDLEKGLKKIKIQEEDIKKYYKENPEYRTAHILLRVRVKKTKEEVEAALAQSLKVFKVLKKDPNKFSELANKFSQSISSETGGDMGFQPASQLAPEYFKAIKGKKTGYISPPVRTQFGYHIIKVLAEKSYENINKALYSKLVFDSKRDVVIQKYFQKMRNNASIEIKTKKLQ
ncbi:MAG: hypothetical protein CME68_04870 [Halobacteriovoraceae bacterium]|nr:hypothetical protein [Halobacteriovoraceae bacterium]